MSRDLKKLEELLVDEATEGLDRVASEELEGLLSEHPDVDRYAYERTAAAVFLSVGVQEDEELPASLRTRLSADADRWSRSDRD